MKLGIGSLGLLLTLTLTGCFDAEVKSEQGNISLCSTEFINDFEDTQSLIEQLQVDGDAELLDSSQRKELVIKTKVACVRMNEKYKSTSCQGLSSSGNQILNYRVSDLISQCVPVAGDALSSVAESAIQLTAIDGAQIVKAGASAPALIYRGKVGTAADFAVAINRGEVLCKIAFSSPVAKIANGAKFDLLRKSEKTEVINPKTSHETKRQRFNMDLSDEKTEIGCFKYSEEPFTVRELRQTLRGLFEISIQN